MDEADPKRRQTMDPMIDGLYSKYFVQRLDDSESHEDCEYFVLDLSHDPFARIAVASYALNCEDEYPELARDLRAKMLRISKLKHEQDPERYPPL